MILCDSCGSEIPDTEERCLTCGRYAGPPNVRNAERSEEIQALEERYREAYERARTKGCLAVLERFDQAVTASFPVVNVDLRFLHFFVTSERTLYTNYEVGVEARSRKPASLYHDLERRGVAGTLFGSYSSGIVYAALSLDGLGPDSFGPYAMRLRDIAVRSRVTVLENNSYHFRKKHKIEPGDQPPPGYTATWDNRHKLAVAKVVEYITPSTAESDFPRLLLSSTGNRATDEFVEVQIYGTFDLNAVEAVKGNSKFVSSDDRDLLRMVKAHLKDSGKEWMEQ